MLPLIASLSLIGFGATQAHGTRWDSYGVLNGKLGDVQIHACILTVTQVLGNGSNKNADIFIEEIIRSETRFGNSKDNTRGFGEGLGQFDKIGFKDTIDRTLSRSSYPRTKKKLALLGIDLEKINYSDLHKSPLLSVAMIRLKFLLVPEAIPLTKQSRFAYYKKHYNSFAGKATVQHYLASNKKTSFYEIV